jgi:thioredoxin reductase
MDSSAADVLILGAGPAGLTAAISLARQMQSSIVFDDGAYRNDPAEYMHLIPGFDHVPPEQFRTAAKENMLNNYKHVRIQLAKVASAEKDAATGQFTLKDEAGSVWQGKKLILANGVEDVFPPIEGYAECWGKAM